MEAWNKKTFSLQEKIMEKAALESLGVSAKEAEDLQNAVVLQNQDKYTEYEINGEEPDAIIFDTDHLNHKAVRYTLPKMIDQQASLKYHKGQKVAIGNGEIMMHLNMYQHQTITTEGGNGLMIWIGSKEACMQQIEDITKSAGYTIEQQNFLKFCPNVEKIKQTHPELTKPLDTPKTGEPTYTPPLQNNAPITEDTS